MHNTLSRRPHLMTVAEFLDWPGDGSGRTFELVDGELRPMSPSSQTHGRIQSTLNALIFIALADAGSPCQIVSAPGVIIARHAHMNMRVPDLGITCAPDSAVERALPDPAVLIEILSPSNATDTWDNVWAYTTIASVREIVVVHSTRVKAELLRRDPDGRWPAEPEEIAADGTLRLESINFACPLRAAYARTHLG
ncbi:MAG: Uma2 family endonuclease [Hyphomicrobiaceae bacterium]